MTLTDAIEDANDDYQEQDDLTESTYEDLLDAFEEYLSSLSPILGPATGDTIETTFFTTAKSRGAEAKEAFNRFIDEAEYVDTNIESDFFNIVIDLQNIYQDFDDERTEAEEAEKQAEEDKKKAEEEAKAATEQEKADATDAEATVDGFVDEYIDGDDAGIRKFMTASFIAEFEFDRLAPDARQFYEPSLYRTLDVVRESEEKYYVYGRLTNKEVAGDDQFSNDFNFTVILDDDTWLVDVDQAPFR